MIIMHLVITSLFGQPLLQLGGDEVTLLTLRRMSADKVMKEKELEYQENDGKLDEDNGPQRAAYSHLPESVYIQ